MKKMIFKVIFIDDEPLVLEGLKALIDWKTFGFEVVGAFDIVEEALDFIGSDKVDFIITDINMPVINGLQLIERLRQQDPLLPICILSGYRDFEYARKAMQLEVTNYLVKPVFDDDLIPVVESVYEDLYNRHMSQHAVTLQISDAVTGLVNNHYSSDDPLLINCISDAQVDGPDSQWQCFMMDCQDQDCTIDRLISDRWLLDGMSDAVLNQFMFHWHADDRYIIVAEVKMFGHLIDGLTDYFKSAVHGPSLYVGHAVTSLARIRESYEACLAMKRLSHPYLTESVIEYESSHKVSGSVDLSDGLVGQHYDKLAQSIKGNDNALVERAIQAVVVMLSEKVSDMNKINQLVLDNRNRLYKAIRGFISELDEGIDPVAVMQRTVSANSLKDMTAVSRLITEDAEVLQSAVAETSGNDTDPVCSEIEKYIAGNLAGHLSLKDIAGLFYMHPNYLGQKLKKHWGMSFNEYLNRQRIERSLDMLSDETIGISTVAELVGYRNYAGYLDYFKRYQGMTPVEYRKRLHT